MMNLVYKNLFEFLRRAASVEADANHAPMKLSAEEWRKIYDNYDSKRKEYKEKVRNLESGQANNEGQEQEEEYKDPDAKVNLDKLNAEQAMERGDEILNADDNAFSNMNGIVREDVNIAKGVNIELIRQNDQFDVADNTLKEMEFSIERARKKITNMFKLYASDKCITCLIVVILIIIITIIIVSACGGDNKNNFNVPHDIFGSNNDGKNSTNSNNTTNDSKYLIKTINLMNVIGLIILYFI